MSGLGGVNGTVCNAQQYQQSLPSETSPNPSITCLTRGQTIGMTLASETALVSLLCVMVLFILIGRNELRYRKALPDGGWGLLQSPSDIYLFTLFLFDIVLALGGALNVRWVRNGIVATGSYCVAQGILKQTGEVGVALATLVLAAHTFVTALWSVGKEARRPAFWLVGLICVFIALWVGLGNGLIKNYEAPTPYWCWISHRFNVERLTGAYLWMWIALFASIVLYIPVYFWATGRLSVGNRNLDPSQRGTANKRATLRLLLIPVSYSLIVLPVSVARWLQYHRQEPPAALIFGESMFNLSGAINVVLFLVSQSQLLLFAPPVMPDIVPTQAATDPVDQSPQPNEARGDLANDSQELRSMELSERSRNSIAKTGDNASQRLQDFV